MEQRYKEKYEQAIERLKQWDREHPCAGFVLSDRDKFIFPELAESEDEKIRKWIIEDIRFNMNNEPLNNSEYRKKAENAIAWLEKQGQVKESTISQHENRTCEENVNSLTSEDERIRKDIKQHFLYLDDSFPDKAKWLTWLEKQAEHANFLSKIQVGDKVTRNENGVLVNLSQLKRVAKPSEKQCEQKFEMKTAEESLGINSDTYNKIVDECIFGEQKPANKIEPKDYSSIDPHFGKPIDKVEPKFHEGEWIVHHGTENIYQVVAVIDNQYQLKYGNTYTVQKCADVDRCARLWDIIKDAKKGDVLTSDYEGGICIALLKNVLSISEIEMYCHLINDDLFIPKSGYSNATWHPATKEQRDLLFKKMKESGYEWDAEKKELCKIEPKPEENKGNIGGISPNWSEEDECYMSECIGAIATKEGWSFEEKRKTKHWLQSLKGRVGCEANCTTTKEWSEEDSIRLQRIIDFLWYNRKGDTDTIYQQEQDIDWLKSLRPQRYLIPSEKEIEKAAQEWDSKANFNPFYMTMENGKPTGVKQSITTHKESFKAGVNWILKFLKPRSIWKPSDKQMNVLWCHCSEGSVLMSLYNDLKKLKDS